MSRAHQHTSFLRNGLRLLAFASFALAASRSNRSGESGKSGRVDSAASSSSVCLTACVPSFFFDRELANHATFKPDAVGNLLCNMLTVRHLIKSNAAYFFPPVSTPCRPFNLFFFSATWSRSFGWAFFLPFLPVFV
jgi:hypothetical protein